MPVRRGGRRDAGDVIERTGPWWHAYLAGVGPGQRYGLRAWGPYEPATGHRHSPAKLLIDPYARALDGELVWNDALFDGNDLDSAPFVAKGVVVDDRLVDAPPSGVAA